ncbi:DUF6380 family protein [Streptomyces sp. NPDC057438]
MDNSLRCESIGEKWYATLRNAVASLTATARPGGIRHPGGPAGEGAR